MINDRILLKGRECIHQILRPRIQLAYMLLVKDMHDFMELLAIRRPRLLVLLDRILHVLRQTAQQFVHRDLPERHRREGVGKNELPKALRLT